MICLQERVLKEQGMRPEKEISQLKETTRLQNEEQERQWNRKQKEYELETERQKKKNRLECV